MSYRKFYQPNSRRWSQWIEMGHITHIACCDCGLVHTNQYDIRPTGPGKVKLMMRTRRHKGKTGLRRRQFRHKCC